MKNVTKDQANKKAKKETAKKEADAVVAMVRKVTTPKSTTTKVQDQATLKVVKEVKRGTPVREKNYIYRFQLDENTKLNAKQEKRLRGKIRRQLKNICDEIILANQKKKDLSKIPAFFKFYKENYILNDLSLASLTNSSDDLKQADLTRVLELAKEAKVK